MRTRFNNQGRPMFDRRAVAVVVVLLLGLWLLAGQVPGHEPIADSTKRLRDRAMRKVNTLVLVPGHGVFHNGRWDVAEWLKPFLPHIEEQIRVALTEYDPKDSLVMFGGGMTHGNIGRVSEGESYITYAKSKQLPNWDKAVAEEYARDSFENVLLSLCRFKQLTGRYPENYVVVGFEFKRERFINEHRRAVRFPLERFVYRGVPKVDVNSIREQIEMERAGTIKQFQGDPYGCSPPLSTKRLERDPFKRNHKYAKSCPEMAGLLTACGPNVFGGPLPWDP